MGVVEETSDNGERVEPGMTIYGGGGYLQREHI
jgi:hypothetical protein